MERTTLKFCILEDNSILLFSIFLICLELLYFVSIGRITEAIILIFITYLSFVIGKKLKILELFYLCFAVNVSFSIIFEKYYLLVYGIPFARGLDEQFFLLSQIEIGNLLKSGDFEGITNFIVAKSFGYLLFGGFIKWFLSLLNMEFSSLTVRLFNAAIGATISVGIYKICCEIFRQDVSRSYYVAIIVGLCPSMIFYSSHIYRDIIISSLYVWFAYLWGIISFKNQESIRYYIFLFGLFLFVGFIRIYSIFPLLITILLDFSFKKKILVKRCLLIISVIIGFFLLSEIFGISIDSLLVEKTRCYSMLARQQASSDSIGLKLIGMPFPFNYIGRILYAIFIPIPPFKNFTFDEIFKGIGAILWYLLFPFLIFYIIRIKCKFSKSVLVLSVVTITGIAFTSLDFRHKIHVFPLLLLLSLIGWYKSTSWEKFFLIGGYGIGLILAFMGYFLLKIL